MLSAGEVSRVVFRERWEVVEQEIRRRILDGELRPGVEAVETELAESMGVSRGPVREALRSLETKGLVLRRPRRPSIVTPLTRQAVDELYSLRAEVESLALRYAMDRNPAALVASMSEDLAALHTAAERSDELQLGDADLRLHGRIYLHSEHSRAQGVWATMVEPLRMMMRITNRSAAVERDRGHDELVDAVATGRAGHAETVLRRHLDEARVRIQPFVEG